MPGEGDDSFWPSAETLSDVGHGILDVAGLIPVFGEPADIANAAWYAAQGNYLEAGLSLISAIPFAGYLGTVGKFVKKFGGKPSKKILEALQKVDFKKAFDRFRSNPKIGSYVDKMVKALEKWRGDLLKKFSPKVKPGRCIECEKKAAAAAAKKLYARPGSFRRGVREKVWEEAKTKTGNGIVKDPLTEKIMKFEDPWDMGHLPGKEFRKFQKDAEVRGLSRKEFLDEYNKSKNYWPELPSSNRSHKLEDMTDFFDGD